MTSFPELYDQIRGHFATSYQDSENLLENVFVECEKKIDWEKVFWENSVLDSQGISEESCVKLKDAGTKFFQKKQYSEAIRLYNDYIRNCQQLSCKPEQKRNLIYQGYTNRSLVLLRTQKYNLCAQDIQAALHHADQDPKKEYPLYERLAKCMGALGNIEEAEKYFGLSLQRLEDLQDLPEQLKSAFINQILKSIQELQQHELEKSPSKSEKSTKIVLENPDPEHHGLSQKTKVTYNSESGRFLVAVDDILPGEVIAVESPVVSFTHFDKEKMMSKVCHHCIKAFQEDPLVGYPSPFVDGVMFCTFQCLQTAVKSYHSHEKYLWNDYIFRTKESQEDLEKSGCMFLAFRSISQKPASFFVDAMSTFLKEDPTFGVDKTKDSANIEKRQLMNLFNLVRHESSLSVEERLQVAIRSVILVQSLKWTQYFSKDDENREMKIALTLLYRLQLGITFNVHLIYRVSGNLSGDIPLGMVGSGVYGDLVLLNHSCAPNTTRFYQSGEMVVVAKKMIRKGEEITNNYGIHHNNLTTEQRKSSLLQSYKFECHCDACKYDYPLLAAINSKLPSKLSKQLESLLSQYQRHFKSGEINEARLACSKYLSKLEHADIKYPHRNYEIGAIALNSCWWAMIAEAQNNA